MPGTGQHSTHRRVTGVSPADWLSTQALPKIRVCMCVNGKHSVQANPTRAVQHAARRQPDTPTPESQQCRFSRGHTLCVVGLQAQQLLKALDADPAWADVGAGRQAGPHRSELSCCCLHLLSHPTHQGRDQAASLLLHADTHTRSPADAAGAAYTSTPCLVGTACCDPSAHHSLEHMCWVCQQPRLQHGHVPHHCLAHAQQLGCCVQPAALLLGRERQQAGQLGAD